jgi:putative SOS response-associated peptidase YedK
MFGRSASDASLSLMVFEWKKLDAKGKLKQPYAIAMPDDGQMVMAGLWARWKSPTSREEVLSCTILTCGPNKVMGELHDRIPIILAEIDRPKGRGEEPASEQDLLRYSNQPRTRP